jgi:patatin-like phospholipase/acyl hydrolase
MARRQILCLSGGGYAGLFAAKFLALLEQQDASGKKIGTRFDAIAGTSVGGLIGLALASGKSAKAVLEVMQRVGPTVFLRKRGGVWRMVLGPKFAAAPLKKHVDELLIGKRLGDLTQPVLIPSISLATGEPKLFRAFPGRRDPDSATSLVDVALATSAAPAYFPPHKIGDDLFADGGLIANAPDHLVILEAITRWGWLKDDLFVLSLGTTYTPPGLLTHSARGWGLFKWIYGDRKLLNISMAAQMALAQTVAGQLLPSGRLLRIDPALGLAQTKEIGLDKANKKAVATLQGLAQDHFGRMDPTQRKQFLTHSPNPP